MPQESVVTFKMWMCIVCCRKYQAREDADACEQSHVRQLKQLRLARDNLNAACLAYPGRRPDAPYGALVSEWRRLDNMVQMADLVARNRRRKKARAK